MRDDDLDDLDEAVLADWQDTVELPLLADQPADLSREAPATTGVVLPATAVLGPIPSPPTRPVPAPPAPAAMWQAPAPWAGPWSTVVVSDRRVPHDAVLVVAWLLAVASFGYLLPWAVAATRGRSNHGGVALVNLLLGWTGVGWAVALVMACSAHRTVLVQVVAPWPAQNAVGLPFATRIG